MTEREHIEKLVGCEVFVTLDPPRPGGYFYGGTLHNVGELGIRVGQHTLQWNEIQYVEIRVPR
jgi:hypothetical protein